MDTPNFIRRQKGGVTHGKDSPRPVYERVSGKEAARLVIEDGMSAGEASARLSVPKSTFENWVRAAKAVDEDVHLAWPDIDFFLGEEFRFLGKKKGRRVSESMDKREK